jgi:MFS family permease
MGPCLGPLFGGWISYRTGQWRWIYWVLFIIVGAVFALTLVMPETLSTIILKKKAAKLNKGNDTNIYITESDLHVIPLSSRLKTAMLRPFILMFMEPIVLFMSFYLSFVYSLLYATFFAFPIAFEEIRGWNASMTGVSFVSIIVSGLHRRAWREII